MSLARIIFLLCLIFTVCQQKQDASYIVSKVKTDKSYVETSLNVKNVYAIEVDRIATNKQDQTSKCTAQQKQIKSINQIQKFRVGSSSARQQSVYEALTTLPDREDGIDSFKILGEKIMLIMMNGTAFFLQTSKKIQKNIQPVDMKIKMQSGNFRFTPKISPINGNAYVATPRDLSFCEPKLNKCTKVQGYKGVDSIYSFHAYQFKGKQFLFFLTGNALTTYEISSNGMALNERIYKADFFKKTKIFLQQIIPIPGNKLLILDFYVGLIQLQHSQKSLADITKLGQVAYDQYGCRHLASQKKGQYLALHCSLTQKTYFILQMSRSDTGKYVSQQPLFFNEVLTGIQINYDVVLANIFSGVKLFWASSEIQSPYPYDYQKAGSIFLHNAKGSQMWTLNDRKVIFICTQDELRIYQLTVTSPEIVCFSMVPIKEQYKIIYTYMCDIENLLHLKVCTVQKKLRYEAWQHKQVGIKTTILPLVVSFMLVLAVGFLLFKLYKKYDNQIQTTRLKYNSNEQFGVENN